jgi:hypothetical protein
LANLTYYFCLDIALQLKRIFCLIWTNVNNLLKRDFNG